MPLAIRLVVFIFNTHNRKDGSSLTGVVVSTFKVPPQFPSSSFTPYPKPPGMHLTLTLFQVPRDLGLLLLPRGSIIQPHTGTRTTLSAYLGVGKEGRTPQLSPTGYASS